MYWHFVQRVINSLTTEKATCERAGRRIPSHALSLVVEYSSTSQSGDENIAAAAAPPRATLANQPSRHVQSITSPLEPTYSTSCCLNSNAYCRKRLLFATFSSSSPFCVCRPPFSPSVNLLDKTTSSCQNPPSCCSPAYPHYLPPAPNSLSTPHEP